MAKNRFGWANESERRISVLRRFRLAPRAILLGTIPTVLLLGAIGLGVRAQNAVVEDVEGYRDPLTVLHDATAMIDALTVERDSSLQNRLFRVRGALPVRDGDRLSLIAARVEVERIATDDAFKQLKRAVAMVDQNFDLDSLPIQIEAARRTMESVSVSTPESQFAYDAVIEDLINQTETNAPTPPEPIAHEVSRYLAMINAKVIASSEDWSIRAIPGGEEARPDLTSLNAVELTYLGDYVNSGNVESNEPYFGALATQQWITVRDLRALIRRQIGSPDPLQGVSLPTWQRASDSRLAMLIDLRDTEAAEAETKLEAAIEEATTQLTLYLALGGVGAGLLMLALFVYARTVTQPLSALHSAANDLSGGRIHPIDDSGNDELSVVANAFRRLHDQMSGLWSDAYEVRRSLEAGLADARIDANKYDGDWNSLVTSFNDTLQASEESSLRLKAEVHRRTCLSEIAERAVTAGDACSVALSTIDRLSELEGVAGCFLCADPETGAFDPKLEPALPRRHVAFDGNLAMFATIHGVEQPLARLVLVWDGPLVDGEIGATERTLEAAARMIAQTDRRETAESLVLFQANHDLATGLPNDQVFDSWVHTRVLDPAARPIAVVALQLRDIARLRSTGGQRLVDLVAKQSAERLRDAVDFDVVVARAESGHFLVGLPSTPTPSAQANQLTRLLREPIFDASGAVETRIDSGYAIVTIPKDARSVTRKALAAAAEAETLDAVDVVPFNAEFQARLDRRRDLELWFDQAITTTGMLTVWYQPIVDARSSRIVGYEALARGFDQAGNPISPADFVPVIEESERIHELGQFVTRRALADLVGLGGKGAYIAINVSPHEIHRGDLVSLFDELDWSKCSRSQLAIEITEGLALIDDAPVMEVLRTLRDRGHPIIVDDFGSGYSSLGYLVRLPVSSVKLDRILIAEIDASDTQYAIAAGAIEMAKAAGLTVVAEGVERQSQLDVLRHLDCDLIQGYLTGVPAPTAAATTIEVTGRPLDLAQKAHL